MAIRSSTLAARLREFAAQDGSLAAGTMLEAAEYVDRTEQVRAAIVNKGPYPAIHDDIHHRHRKEWPTLWRAIDHLLR